MVETSALSLPLPKHFLKFTSLPLFRETCRISSLLADYARYSSVGRDKSDLLVLLCSMLFA